jgi:acyl carrier protein
MKITDHEIKELVAEKLGLDSADISNDYSFTNDLAIDSLDFYELIMEVEKKFNIKVSDDNAKKITTVHSLIEYVNEAR